MRGKDQLIRERENQIKQERQDVRKYQQQLKAEDVSLFELGKI